MKNSEKKKPAYRYSQLYQDWKAAKKRNDTEAATKLGKQHTEYWLGQEPEPEKFY